MENQSNIVLEVLRFIMLAGFIVMIFVFVSLVIDGIKQVAKYVYRRVRRYNIMEEKKLLKIFVKIYWRIRIIFLSLRWIPQVNLGDIVIYNGDKYTVCNGVRPMSWRLEPSKDLSDSGWVSRKECRKVWSLKNIWYSFYSGYNFYMTSWFQIWANNGIKDWMHGCNIWPWPFRK